MSRKPKKPPKQKKPVKKKYASPISELRKKMKTEVRKNAEKLARKLMSQKPKKPPKPPQPEE